MSTEPQSIRGISQNPPHVAPYIFSEPPLPTVRVKCSEHPAGYILVNRSDFDPATMKLAD
jgi:hypothetical protein